MPRRETWCWLPAMPRVIAPARVGADAYRCGGEVPAWAWPTSPGAGRHTPRRLPGRTRMIVSLGGRQGKGCDAAGRASTGLRLRLANGRGYTSDTCAAGPPVATLSSGGRGPPSRPGIGGRNHDQDRDHRRHRRRGPGHGDAVRQGRAGGAHRLAFARAGGGGRAKGEGGAARGYGGGASQRRGGRTRRGRVPDRPLGRPPELPRTPRRGDRREGPRRRRRAHAVRPRPGEGDPRGRGVGRPAGACAGTRREGRERVPPPGRLRPPADREADAGRRPGGRRPQGREEDGDGAGGADRVRAGAGRGRAFELPLPGGVHRTPASHQPHVQGPLRRAHSGSVSVASPELRVIGVGGLPEVSPGDDLSALIAEAASRQGTPLEAGDVVVVTQKIVSKAEGRGVALADVEPGPEAAALAAETAKDPRLVELVLRESR